jgi:hypothetical protein
MESVEEVSRLLPEILERLGPQTLSPEHQATVILHPFLELDRFEGSSDWMTSTIHMPDTSIALVASSMNVLPVQWDLLAGWTVFDVSNDTYSCYGTIYLRLTLRTG